MKTKNKEFDKAFNVLFSKQERIDIRTAAGMSDISMSEFIRCAIDRELESMKFPIQKDPEKITIKKIVVKMEDDETHYHLSEDWKIPELTFDEVKEYNEVISKLEDFYCDVFLSDNSKYGFTHLPPNAWELNHYKYHDDGSFYLGELQEYNGTFLDALNQLLDKVNMKYNLP